MVSSGRVVGPPGTPLLVFDGDCGFCRWWIARWKSRLGNRLEFEPFQTAAARFPEIPEEAFSRAVQLLLPTGEVFAGAEAVFRALAVGDSRAPLWLYERVPLFAWATELAYRFVARHRSAASRVTLLLWGRDPEPPTYVRSSRLFLVLLALSYLAAFLSLWVQVHGLIGSRGILPATDLLDWARSNLGSERYRLLPTLCWLSSSDGFLDLLCGGGVLASCTLLAGVAPSLCLAVLWILYLSLCVAGQTFLEFQWDLLLLEAGLIAIFLPPPALSRAKARAGPFSRGARLLLVWLLFRLVFSSGVVKLSSGDPNWRNLSALVFHYQTQPLPPWTAWYLHQFSGSFQKASCLFLFAVELGAPWLLLGPRRIRLAGAGAIVFLQALIALTGNYAFFNWLTAALCVLVIDDSRFVRSRVRERPNSAVFPGWPRAILFPFGALVFLLGLVQLSGAFRFRFPWPRSVLSLAQIAAPLRSVNSYGLFSVMTTTRPEIVVEGSQDGDQWIAYSFRWKPGDPLRRPRFVAPHQPRLDWQMWFAALGSYRDNPWLVAFLFRLLEGSPEVESLLAQNPFGRAPPRYVRAVLYDYRFTDAATRRRTGAWWTREPIRLYVPAISREMFQRGTGASSR